MAANVRAHPQPVFPGLFIPVLGLFIPVVSEANLTGCRVERGLLECSRDEGVAGMIP